MQISNKSLVEKLKKLDDDLNDKIETMKHNKSLEETITSNKAVLVQKCNELTKTEESLNKELNELEEKYMKENDIKEKIKIYNEKTESILKDINEIKEFIEDNTTKIETLKNDYLFIDETKKNIEDEDLIGEKMKSNKIEIEELEKEIKNLKNDLEILDDEIIKLKTTYMSNIEIEKRRIRQLEEYATKMQENNKKNIESLIKSITIAKTELRERKFVRLY